MGCAQSRIDNVESVSRCKDRRNLMKEAVSARNAFAAGHTGYAVALKSTGAALSDYGHWESEQSNQSASLHGEAAADHHAATPPPHIDSLLPPPPPLPSFSPSPIKRVVNMPEFPGQRELGLHADGPASGTILAGEEEEDEVEKENERGEKVQNLQRARWSNWTGRAMPSGGGVGRKVVAPPSKVVESSLVPSKQEPKGMAWDYFFIADKMPGPTLGDSDGEEGEDEKLQGGIENERLGKIDKVVNGVGVKGCEEEPKTPEKEVEERAEGVQIEHSNAAPVDLRRAEKVAAVPSITLMKVLRDIEDHFLKASKSAQEVSKMLEASCLHYHSNFADNRGRIDHSARVMRVITWNKSFRGVSNSDGGEDDIDADKCETLAAVLDKLLAWEKKLYDEVKQGELMKFEYRRKVSLLNKQKKRGVSAESLAKTKAAVSHLHTRYVVDMQSVDSTASEINNIRDQQLYPMLISLVNAMTKMWESMCFHHDAQQKIVNDLMSLDILHAPPETTENSKERTILLHGAVLDWLCQFEKLTTHQKKYTRALTGWLELNLVPIESSLREKIPSPPLAQNPPIRALLQTWHDLLEKLPDDLAKSAIDSFAAAVKTIVDHQEEEMKLKEKCEEARKEFMRKNQEFKEWHQKFVQRKGSEVGDDGNGNPDDPVIERQAMVVSSKKRWEEEAEAHRQHCILVREKSVGSLRIRLPELFRAMSDYAHSCSDAYQALGSAIQAQK